MTTQITLNSRICCSRIATIGKIERYHEEAKLCLMLVICAAAKACQAAGMRARAHNCVAEQRVGISLPGVWPSIEHCLDNESQCKCVKFF
jgi:hypothetical protein